MRASFKSFAAALALSISLPAFADFSGDVTRIIDGDTVEVVTKNEAGKKRAVRVRLADIDAPESKQDFGNRSRQHLAQLIFRKIVRVEEKETDRYGRTLGVIHSEYCDQECRPINVNAQMVVDGMAWAYRFKNRPTSNEFYQYEQQAKQAKRGLWSNPHAQEPWNWRRANK